MHGGERLPADCVQHILYARPARPLRGKSVTIPCIVGIVGVPLPVDAILAFVQGWVLINNKEQIVYLVGVFKVHVYNLGDPGLGACRQQLDSPHCSNASEWPLRCKTPLLYTVSHCRGF